MAKRTLTRAQVADILEAFIEETGGRWDWDDFVSFRVADSELDEIRIRCAGLSAEFPPAEPGHYCGTRGLEVMRKYIRQLRGEAGTE